MTQPRKTGLPLELHGALGMVVSSIRTALVHAEVFLGTTYSKQMMRRVAKPRLALDRLRYRLDTAVFCEYPTLAHATRIYYPVALQPPSVAPTSLEEVCRMLDASGVTMHTVAQLLFEHYPVTLGDAAIKIANALTYQATELPYVVGPPNHNRVA